MAVVADIIVVVGVLTAVFFWLLVALLVLAADFICIVVVLELGTIWVRLVVLRICVVDDDDADDDDDDEDAEEDEAPDCPLLFDT